MYLHPSIWPHLSVPALEHQLGGWEALAPARVHQKQQQWHHSMPRSQPHLSAQAWIQEHHLASLQNPPLLLQAKDTVKLKGPALAATPWFNTSFKYNTRIQEYWDKENLMVLINHWFCFVFSLQNFNCSLLIDRIRLIYSQEVKRMGPYVWILWIGNLFGLFISMPNSWTPVSQGEMSFISITDCYFEPVCCM
jgi:hypothetical protein